jgi:hypothetical protein
MPSTIPRRRLPGPFYGQIDELLGEECGVLVDDAVSQPSGFAGAGHGERGPVSYRP